MSLASLRTGLASDLATATGITVYSTLPEVMTPPAIVLAPDDPWVSSGQVFGSWRVGYVITIYVEWGEYATIDAAIEDALPDVLGALGEWGLEQIGKPYDALFGEVKIPAVDVTVALDTVQSL